MIKQIFSLISKGLDIIFKRSKSGEKEQEIEVKKIDTYNKVIGVIILVSLTMCVLSSLFPQLAISEWWYEVFERTLKSIVGG